MKHPIITDDSETTGNDVGFEFDENTSVYSSCSMIYKNQLLVYGGTNSYGGDKRQISKLSGCRLQRIGTLDYDHDSGACTGVNDTRIFLCFNMSNSYFVKSNKCSYATDQLGPFTEAASSAYDHEETSIAASDCR